MRKTPRLATLLLGLAVVVIAIWRLFTCASSPPPLPELSPPAAIFLRARRPPAHFPASQPAASPAVTGAPISGA